MVKKIIGMFLGFVLVTVLGVGAYAFTIYQQSTQTLAKTYKQIGEETKVIEATEPMTILLMGVDTGNVERTDPWAGNSDSMILVTVNPKTKKVVMMSLVTPYGSVSGLFQSGDDYQLSNDMKVDGQSYDLSLIHILAANRHWKIST